MGVLAHDDPGLFLSHLFAGSLWLQVTAAPGVCAHGR